MKYCWSVIPEVDARLSQSRRVLIATDFDGTLCPIADSPTDVRMAPAMLEILCRAVSCNRLTLAVISGRALADIKRRLPLDVFFAGNHGLEIAGSGFSFEHDGAATEIRSKVTSACELLTPVLRKWPAAWVEDKGLSATLHYRKVEQRYHSSLLFAARHAMSVLGACLALRVGRLALEIRPNVQWDKGRALQYIRERAGPFDFCICLGDDRTDETMFRVNRGQFNIRIGYSKQTAATSYLRDSVEVAIFLTHIVDTCASAERSIQTEKAQSVRAGTGSFNNGQ